MAFESYKENAKEINKDESAPRPEELTPEELEEVVEENKIETEADVYAEGMESSRDVLPEEASFGQKEQISEEIQNKREEIKEAEANDNEEQVLMLEDQLRALERKESESAKETHGEDGEERKNVEDREGVTESKPEAMLRELSLDNRNFVQKLPEKSWDFLKRSILKPPIFAVKAFKQKIEHKLLKDSGEVERNYGFVGSRIGVLFNSLVIDREKTGWIRHGTSLEGLQSKYDQHEEEMKELKNSVAEIDNQEKEMEAEGVLTSAMKLKLENTRQKIGEKIEKQKDKLEVLGNRLEEANNRIKIYEAKREQITQGLLERVDARLTPLLERAENLEGDKEKLESDISDFSSFVEEKEGKLEEIAQKISKYPHLKKPLVLRKKKMEEVLKKAKRSIKEKSAEAVRIDKSLSLLNERANPWVEMKSKFENILERKTQFAAPGREENDELDLSGLNK